jgi:diguanylate cyclase (GGDEF)-like protein/PAS domain S-box-containing protein
MSHYAFNWLALPPGLTAVCSLVAGLLVMRREWASRVGRALFMVTATISVWLGASAVAYCSTDAPTGLFWTQLAYIGVPLLPAALCLYVSVALRLYQRLRILVWTIMIVGLGFLGLAQNGQLLLSGVEKQWWGYYPTYGVLGAWFVGYFVAMIVFGIVLLRTRLRQTPKGSAFRRRINMSLLALQVISVAGVDFPAKFGVTLYPFGCVAVLVFLGVILVLERRYRIVYMTPAFAAEQILATMQGAVLVTGLDGTVEMSNRAAGKLLGHQEAGLLELSLNEVFASHMEWRGLIDQCIEGIAVQDCETLWKPRNGRPIDVSISASLLHDSAGRSLGVVFVALDITDRKLWEQALATEKEHLARLNEAAVAISRCLTVSEVQRAGIQLACKTTGSDGGIILPLPLGARSRVIGNKGLSRRGRGQLKRILKNSAAVERVLREKTSERLGENDVLKQAAPGSDIFTGALIVPVLLRGDVIALFCLATKGDHGPLTAADSALADGVAALIGVALANARLYDDAKYLSQRDPVTGLLNHRGIRAPLDKELARSERSGGHFAVMMMDLDNFKLLNDTYGHASGDRVLQEVAAILSKSVRRGDYVGRYGGDEFLALLPDTDAGSALKTIERVKQTLDEFAWRPDGEAAVPLCMSYGVATYPFEGRRERSAGRGRRESLSLEGTGWQLRHFRRSPRATRRDREWHLHRAGRPRYRRGRQGSLHPQAFRRCVRASRGRGR